MDGTLLNTIEDIRDCMNKALAELSLPTHATERYFYFVGSGVKALSESAVGESNVALAPEAAARYKHYYAQNSAVKTHPYPGIHAALKALADRGLPLAVFSNKPHADTQRVIAAYFPDIAFAAVRGQQESIPVKPHPQGALEIAQQLGVAPADCLYVGDTIVDMRCAEAAGMVSVGVTWGFRTMKELVEGNAQHIIHVPDELLPIALSAVTHLT